jgi:hypothetical protein
MDLPTDIWNLIFQEADDYHCLIVCKSWYDTIIKKCEICEKCNKIVKMYDTILWISDEKHDIVCHGYYEDDMEKYDLLRKMISANPESLRVVKRKSIGLWLWGLKRSHIDYNCIKNVDESWYYHAFKISPFYIKYIKDPTFEMCFKAVHYNGSYLQYIPEKHQTHGLCLMSIKKDINNAQYIINQTEELWLEYIRTVDISKMDTYMGYCRSGTNEFMKYIKNPTEIICLEVVKKHPECLTYAKFT